MSDPLIPFTLATQIKDLNINLTEYTTKFLRGTHWDCYYFDKNGLIVRSENYNEKKLIPTLTYLEFEDYLFKKFNIKISLIEHSKDPLLIRFEAIDISNGQIINPETVIVDKLFLYFSIISYLKSKK